MKLSIFILLAAMSVFACDTYEAQFIAKVTEVETDSLTYCRAKISAESIALYNEHILCPLDMSEVIAKGISLPLINGHDCEVSVGEQISGYLYTRGNTIQLD
tara:strand:+ start:293168 stop:293473 length:306 start_codon:yes stop_codon:yes gene_type:complete